MRYSYAIAKEVLSENDKNRILCLYLNCNPSAINWAQASADFGCASIDSMKVMTRTALKKIENAGGKIDDDGDGNAVAATPTTKKSGGGGRKRKVKEVEGDDEEIGMETPGSTKKNKAAGGKGKKDDVSPGKGDDSAVDSGNETYVKPEPVEDDEAED